MNIDAYQRKRSYEKLIMRIRRLLLQSLRREYRGHLRPSWADCNSKMKVPVNLFYIGAGTSGRLGVLDAARYLPISTYGVDKGQLLGLWLRWEIALCLPLRRQRLTRTCGRLGLLQPVIISFSHDGELHVLGGYIMHDKLVLTRFHFLCEKCRNFDCRLSSGEATTGAEDDYGDRLEWKQEQPKVNTKYDFNELS